MQIWDSGSLERRHGAALEPLAQRMDALGGVGAYGVTSIVLDDATEPAACETARARAARCQRAADTLICQGGARAHLRERRLLASGRAAARAKTPDMSTILMSPLLSGASLTVISRPSYVTLAPTSNDEPCTSLLLT